MRPSKILVFPDPRLREVSKPIVRFDQQLRTDVKHLQKIMYSQPYGLGLAAPQLGILKRIVVIDLSSRVKGAEPMVLINPKVVSASGQVVNKEGCMSIPEYRAYVNRPNKIVLRWQGVDSKPSEQEFEGFEAVCIQHEIDHLDGILFIDRVSCLKSDMKPRRR